ncbi:MAG: DUF551 domain-containing protein [Lachnospiraceae bacterium]|nr:DUF551 domain-containing protein [Lachnospiraceae bacterium]
MSEWIPVTERLPEESGFYLATHEDDGHYEVGVAFYDGVSFTNFYSLRFTAWMPLPEPYKGGER